MSYHNTSSSSSSSSSYSTSTSSQRQSAPPGYHYMPDGSLMLDSAMQGAGMAPMQQMLPVNQELEALERRIIPVIPIIPIPVVPEEIEKTITSFVISTSTLNLRGENRNFIITGTPGFNFYLEVLSASGLYYNFISNAFQATATRFTSKNGNIAKYRSKIHFPLSGSATTYTIRLFAMPGTKHNNYYEVRLADGSVDVNNSIGSNSLLLSKTIDQKANKTITLSAISFSSLTTFSGSTTTSQTFSASGGAIGQAPFLIPLTVGATHSVLGKRLPDENDLGVYVQRTIGANPIDIPGENIYPTATGAFTGDDVNGAVTSGSVVRMDNTDLSAVILVGDKITTPVTTDTVNCSDCSSATAIIMDAAVATKMAVGDRVTGNTVLGATEITVAAINVGSDANTFSLSSAVAIADGTTLTFSSKINRSLTTVTVVETSSTDTVNGARDASGVAVTMDAAVASKMAVGDIVTGNTALDAGTFTVASLDSTNVFSLSSAVAIADDVTLTFRTATDFTMSQAIQFRDNAPLTFFNRMNFRWPISDVTGLMDGVIASGTNTTANAVISTYKAPKIYNANTEEEVVIQKQKPPAVGIAPVKAVITKNATTKSVRVVQEGYITFNEQQKLALGGDTLKFVAKGMERIKHMTDWDLSVSDITLTVTNPTTTTTAAVNSSTSVPIASGDGIMDDVSTVSGIGISNSALSLGEEVVSIVKSPTVTNIGSYSGTTATLTLSTPQTLESGTVLTFSGGAGRTINVGGKLTVNEVGKSFGANEDLVNWNGVVFFDVDKFLTATNES